MPNQKQIVSKIPEDLDRHFDQIEQAEIPADIFGKINPQWRVVMKNYFNNLGNVQQTLETQYLKKTEKIQENCLKLSENNQKKYQQCLLFAEQKLLDLCLLKEAYELELSQSANKCLNIGNSVDFCTQQINKEKVYAYPEFSKLLNQI